MLEQMIGNLSKSIMQIGVMVFVLIVVAVIGFFAMNMKKYNEVVRIREPGGKTYSRKARRVKDSSGAFLLEIQKFKDKIQYPTPSFTLPNGKPVHELYRTFNPKLPFVPMKFAVKEGIAKLVGEDLDPLIWASHDNIEADKQYNKWEKYLPLIQTGALFFTVFFIFILVIYTVGQIKSLVDAIKTSKGFGMALGGFVINKFKYKLFKGGMT